MDKTDEIEPMHSPKITPPNLRPYQLQHVHGGEMQTRTRDRRQIWRQVGWQGQSGAFYALAEDPSRYEPGSFSPLWLLVDTDEHVHHVTPDDEKLWAVHVLGTDDVVAVKGHAEAKRLAAEINTMAQTLRERPDASELDPHLSAEVVEWRGTAAEHAEELAAIETDGGYTP